MRVPRAIAMAVLLILLPGGLGAEIGEAGEMGEEAAAARTGAVMAKLAEFNYVAKRDIPASDGIFIDNGRLIESIYKLAYEEYETELLKGETTRVSSVLLLDKAVQVFFAEDESGVIILPKGDANIGAMTVPELVDLAKRGISTLFVSTPEKKEGRPAAPTS